MDPKNDSLIANVLKRKALPLCGLVVSSRPHASQQLRQQAAIRVDILGFTETEQRHYIEEGLPNQPDKAKMLSQYLQQHPSIDNVCFIPFNMASLLHLYKQGVSFPENYTELYSYFICSIISGHLAKSGRSFAHDITNLNELPEPCNKIINCLSKLSLEALKESKLVFTLEEITAACSEINIEDIPGAIKGFGLLQAVQHSGLYTQKTTLKTLCIFQCRSSSLPIMFLIFHQMMS